jgi:hypothetical protein
VIEAVADARDTDPLDLPPLYDVVDPDALNHLFEYDPDALVTGVACIRFEMAGCSVVVRRDGSVEATATPTPTARGGESDATKTALD